MALAIAGFPAPVRAGVPVEVIAASGREEPGLPPGISLRALSDARIDDQGRVLFQCLLAGPGVHWASEHARSLFSGSGLVLLTRDGDPVPGRGPEVVFRTSSERPIGDLSDQSVIDRRQLAVLNNNGGFAFVVEMAGPDLQYPATLGICTGTSREDLALFVQGGAPGPPAIPGTTFGDATFGYNLTGRDAPEFNPRSELRLNDAGEIALEAYLEGERALDYPTRDGWNGTSAILVGEVAAGAAGLEPVLQVGEPIPGTDEVVGPINWILASFKLNNRGLVSVTCSITFNGEIGHHSSSPFIFRYPARSAALFSSRQGDVDLFGASGLPIPREEGLRFGLRVSDAAINDAGRFVVFADLGGTTSRDGRESLWKGDATGEMALLAREGDLAPGMPPGTVFSNLLWHAINSPGAVAFAAQVTGPGIDSANDVGIWTGTGPDDIELVVREEDPAAGVPGAALSRPGRFMFNDRNEIVFRSRLDVQPDDFWWAWSPGNGLRLILGPGDVVPVGPDELREVRSFSVLDFVSNGDDGRPRALSDTGVLALGVTFADGSEGITLARLDPCDPEAPDDGAPIITRPRDVVVETDDPTGAVVEFEASVRDDCDPAPAVGFTPESGSAFPLGTTTVTCVATDAGGNRSECAFDVTVVCSAGLESDCDGNCVEDAVDVRNGTARDCNGNGVPDQCDVAGSPFDFDSPRIVRTSGTPDAIVTGDFDRDGVLDLALTTTAGGMVMLLLGRGDGAFESRGPFAAGIGSALAAADLTGDGVLDVVNGDSADLVLLPGNGDGTLREPRTIPVGIAARAIVAADLDADGTVDLAAAGERELVALLGNGDGTFRPSDRVWGSLRPNDIIALDLDGDGLRDLATVGGRTIALFFGDGRGRFRVETADVNMGQQSLGAADFDADGSVDLATGHSPFVVLLPGGRDGGRFERAELISADRFPTSLAAADLDQDGIPDVATVNAVTDDVFLFRGRRDAPPVPEASVPIRQRLRGVLVAGDFDGTGTIDLVTAISESVVLLLNRTRPPAGPDADGNSVPDECEGGLQRPGDCDQNGRLNITDAVCALRLLFARRLPFGPPCDDAPGVGGASATVLDFNGDDRVDVSDPIGMLSFLFLQGPPHVLGTRCTPIAGCPARCDR